MEHFVPIEIEPTKILLILKCRFQRSFYNIEEKKGNFITSMGTTEPSTTT